MKEHADGWLRTRPDAGWVSCLLPRVIVFPAKIKVAIRTRMSRRKDAPPPADPSEIDDSTNVHESVQYCPHCYSEFSLDEVLTVCPECGKLL